MTQTEMREYYANKKPIAVYADGTYGGLEIMDIEYGVDDYVICRWNHGKPEDKYHRIKINYSKSVPTFRIDGYSISMNNVVRL